jgi:hypothetical protein
MFVKEKQQKILDSIDDIIRAAHLLKTPEVIEFIEKSSLLIADCFKSEGKNFSRR